jgi:tetratricopeptide (TPR) repeat protein
MSPEQAAGAVESLGAASDVYSLGAILYVVLTGQPAFGGGTAAVLEQVRQGRFAPPRRVKGSAPRALEAVCLKAMARLPDERYGSTRELAADVERWLADEPTTAWREPWTERARRWTRRHRTLMASVGVLLLTTTVSLAVGLGLVNAEKNRTKIAHEETNKALERVTIEEAKTKEALAKVTEEQSKTQAALEKSRAAEAIAKEQTQLALDTVKSVVEDIHEQLKDKPALQELRKKLLNTAEKGLNKVARNAETAGQIDHAAIQVHFELGDIFLRIDGATLAAREQYETAHALAEKLADADKGDAQAQLDLSVSFIKLGDVRRQLGRTDAVLDSYRRSLDIAQRLADADKGNAHAQRDLWRSLINVGDAQLEMDVELKMYQMNAARDSNRLQSMDIIIAALGHDDKDSAQAQRDLAISLKKMGDVQRWLRQTEAALASYRRSLDIAQRLADADQGNAHAQRDLAISLNKVGDAQLRLADTKELLKSYRAFENVDEVQLWLRDAQFRLADTKALLESYRAFEVDDVPREQKAARDSYRRSLEISQKLADADQGNAQAQRDLLVGLVKLGDVQLRLADTKAWLGGKFEVEDVLREQNAARDSYRRSLEISQKLADADKGNAQAQRDLAVSFERLGNVQLRLGGRKAALESYRRTLEINQKLADADQGNAQAQRDLAISLIDVGDAHRLLRERNAALESYRRSLNIRQQLADADKGNVQAQWALFVSCWYLGKIEEEVMEYDRAAEWFKKGRAVLEPLRKAEKLTKEQLHWLPLAEETAAFCETRAKAVADLEFALKPPAEWSVPALLMDRIKAWHRKGKHAEVAATADKLQDLADRDPLSLGWNKCQAACGYALASTCADADDKTKEAHAAKAVALLKELRDKGFFTEKIVTWDKNGVKISEIYRGGRVNLVKEGADFDALRQRDDFKALLVELEKDAK